MGNQPEVTHAVNSPMNTSTDRIKNNRKPMQLQGILKYSHMPFTDSHKIQLNNETMYVERTRMNLQQLIRNKQRIKKIFEADEILKIIQDITYALAIMEQNNIVYPLIALNNIFVCHGHFKLMPPEIINADIYELAKNSIKNKNKQIYPISPQMIIALRCFEDRIQQRQIWNKSNVFSFGMILLEVCTLKSFTFCYDEENLYILNQVINERLQQIQQNYSDKVTRIIANMLDYDFEERFSLKELSIWVNREINQSVSVHQALSSTETQPVSRSRLILQKQSGRQNNTQNQSQISPRKVSPSNKKTKVWQKIKKHKQKNRSKSIKTITTIGQQNNNSKFLVNPYFNEINTKTQLKYYENNKKYENIINNSRGKFDYFQEHENQRYGKYDRYDQYERNDKYNRSDRNDRNRNSKIDVKYKYNLNQDSEISPRQRYSPRRDQTSHSPRVDYIEQRQKNDRIHFDLEEEENNKILKSYKLENHKKYLNTDLSLLKDKKGSKVSQNESKKQSHRQERYWRHLGDLGSYGNTGMDAHGHKGRNKIFERENIDKENQNLKFVQQEIEKSKKILAELKKSETADDFKF